MTHLLPQRVCALLAVRQLQGLVVDDVGGDEVVAVLWVGGEPGRGEGRGSSAGQGPAVQAQTNLTHRQTAARRPFASPHSTTTMATSDDGDYAALSPLSPRLSSPSSAFACVHPPTAWATPAPLHPPPLPVLVSDRLPYHALLSATCRNAVTHPLGCAPAACSHRRCPPHTPHREASVPRRPSFLPTCTLVPPPTPKPHTHPPGCAPAACGLPRGPPRTPRHHLS